MQDVHGFIDTAYCDSLLFSGLLAATSDVSIDLLAARDADGRWHRRPAKDCYPAHSKSSISRDMLLGVMAWAWHKERLDVLEDLWDYGETHSWVMGEGDLTRTFFTPTMQTLLARQIHALGGSDYAVRHLPILLDSNLTGFQAHLSVIIVWLSGEAVGDISQSHLDLLSAQAARQPSNAFFSYLCAIYSHGNLSSTERTLMDTQLFPADRLPTSLDRKESWLWQRDAGDDWSPRPLIDGFSRHHGGDYLFLEGLMR
jgi:hypothetical protein